ncbi:MAG: hypothetical protein HYY96_04785 [Candidatus Tectomicrobia bacterium]|nr:hypothetical protein [Candidatus Tectomicrobia bacterium]
MRNVVIFLALASIILLLVTVGLGFMAMSGSLAPVAHMHAALSGAGVSILTHILSIVALKKMRPSLPQT